MVHVPHGASHGARQENHYKPIKTEEGKVYVSPEDEQKLLVASKLNLTNSVVFETEKKAPRRESNSSDSLYETPIQSKSEPATPGEPANALKMCKTSEDVTSVPDEVATPHGARHSLPFYGRKRRLFPDNDSEAPSPKKSPEEEEAEEEGADGMLKLPPNIEQISSSDEGNGKKGAPRVSLKFPRLFRKSKAAGVAPEEAARGKVAEVTPDPLNEQIPVEVNFESGEESTDREAETPRADGKKRSTFGLFPKHKAPAGNGSDGEKKTSDESDSNGANGNEKVKPKDRRRMTLKSIFGIENDGREKKPAKEESFKEMTQKEPREVEDKLLEILDGPSPGDDEKVTEFKGEEGDAELEDVSEVIKFPTSIPLRGRWGPKSRRSKAVSAPDVPEGKGRDSPGKAEDGEGREGILSPPWRKNKKTRPVSFADEPTIYDLRSDTESADHGSADKSSVSKLTEEKQQKRFLGQLLDTIKRKNKDKVADNEALRNIPMAIDKDVEQQLQKDHIQKDHLKTDGIVYAELDMARSQGNVVRRDDEKTEYAEIIHPKAADFKRSRDELRKSRENLSASREHLTEDDGTTTTPDGKKEAAV